MDNMTEREKMYFKVFQHDYWAESATTLAEKDELDQKRVVLLEQAQALPAIEIVPLVWDHSKSWSTFKGFMFTGRMGLDCLAWHLTVDYPKTTEFQESHNFDPTLDLTSEDIIRYVEDQYQEHCASIIKKMEGKDNG